MTWLAVSSLSAAPRSSDAPVLTDASKTPDGLSTSDWSSIRATYEAGRHAIYADAVGWQTRNPGQQWRTRFDGRGFENLPDANGWKWGWNSSPAAEPARVMTTPGCVNADGPYVRYEWDESLTEWFINDQRGLEHGFTVNERPEGDGSLLHFTLAVRGGLQPRVSVDGRGMTFVNGARRGDRELWRTDRP